MKNLLRKIRDHYRRWYLRRHGWKRRDGQLERWTDPLSTRVEYHLMLSRAYRLQQARNKPYVHIVHCRDGWAIYPPTSRFAVGRYPTREDARRIAVCNGWRVR
jgi:hypothetical protein